MEGPQRAVRVNACVGLLDELEAAGLMRLAPKRQRAASRPGPPQSVPATDLKAIQLEQSAFHGEWNYVIRPHNAS